MSRADYDIARTRCSAGVNENAEEAAFEECADALNVWAPNGRIETRPGYVGLTALVNSSFGSSTITVWYMAKEVAGVFTDEGAGGALTLGALVKDRDRWYVGAATAFSVFEFSITTPNTANTLAKMEYWNGTAWTYVQHLDYAPSHTARSAFHLQGTLAAKIAWAQPSDWATTAVNNRTAYWVRFNIQGNDLSAGTAVDADSPAFNFVRGGVVTRGVLPVQFPATRRYITVIAQSVQVGHDNMATLFRDGVVGPSDNTDVYAGTANAPPAQIAVVPQFDEAFVAYDHRVLRHSAYPETTDTLTATVEDRDFAVGPGADYDKRFIAMESQFPRANLISFFAGRLWAAGIENEPFTIRWSSAAPYHKVWTSLAIEYLMEDDNSPIVAIHPLNEHMVVFKGDSIWIMIPVGENPATGVEAFVPKRVVAGVGCVAPNSIQQVRGELIFLAEDGLYSFNGTPAIRKVTQRDDVDRLYKTMNKVSMSRAPYASSVHWRSRNVYILSFSTSGTANDTTLVWDYAQDVLWLWDNIDAQHWLRDEGADNKERIFFGDSVGRVFEFGRGKNDHGAAINYHVETQPFGLMDDLKRTLRMVKAFASNHARTLTVQATVNDSALASTSTLTFTDVLEKDWTDFTWDGASDNWTPERRRQRRADINSDFDWASVKVSGNTKDQRMYLTRIDLGHEAKGRR